MARIGRQIPHFQEIDTNTIDAGFSDDMVYRYTLDMHYKASLLRQNQNEHISVILKNPSSADESRADATIRKVETYVYKHFPRVNKLSILNMFAIRATDVKEVNQLLNEYGTAYITGPENNARIERVFSESDHIICAWGNNNGIKPAAYFERVKEVTRLIQNSGKPARCVSGPKPTKQPLHGLMWGFDYPNTLFMQD
ncbi:MAG TPA: DUF1643 domain-containing protein [Bacteroidales bacterium]|nr:DUF1643 domain-containing protein [Bacteroidales bacterium]